MTPHFSVSETLTLLRLTRPLILNVTNTVAMDFSANALLAVGASPIMATDPMEVSELVAAAQAVVINMGTLNPEWMNAASRACATAKELKKPLVFDPVGAGATRLRTETARRLLNIYEPEVVRGNASEILALFSGVSTGKGVDAGTTPDRVFYELENALQERKPTFVLSGPTDYILGPHAKYFVQNGDPKMAQVTAMGCVSTCLIAAFRAVEADSALAALKAMAVMGICGERAAAQSQGPGSLRVRFLDLLARPDCSFEEQIRAGSV